MTAIVGKGGSKVDFPWQYNKEQNDYDPMLVKLPENFQKTVDNKVGTIVNNFIADVSVVLDKGKQLVEKDVHLFNKLLKEKKCQVLHLQTNIGDLWSYWDIQELQDTQKKYTDANVDYALSQLDSKRALVYNVVIAKIVKRLRTSLKILDPILELNNIPLPMDGKDQMPISFYESLLNMQLMKSIAFACFKELKMK